MIFLFLVSLSFLFPQEELVDGVLAVVGNKSILFSEVLSESRMKAERKGVSPQSSPLLFQNIFDSVLKEKIYLNVVLISAEKDSLISVSYDEIKNNLDERIDLFSKQLGSVEELEKAFGLPVSDIKDNYWESVKNELMIEKFRFSLLGETEVSKKEILDFYDNYKDSIPGVSEIGSFSLVEKEIRPSPGTIKTIKARLSSIKDSLLTEKNTFEYFAKKHSQDPSVSFNGGVVVGERNGDLPFEYEKAVFSMKKDEIVGPIKTKLGYHLIKLLERVGEKTTSQHILIQTSLTKQDSLSALSFLDSLKRATLNDPGLFDSLSVSFKTSKNNLSGYYDSVDLSFFPDWVKKSVIETKPFSFSSIFNGKNSFFVLYKYSYEEPVSRNPKNSWSFIESLALNKKRIDLFDLWIENQLENVYVKINKAY